MTTPSDEPPSHGGWSDDGDAVAGPPPAPIDPSERYVVGARLGAGGMGVVHAARDRALGRDVALKVLRPDQGADPRTGARLAREAALTSRLDHPGVVTVYDAGRLPDGRAFYSMRLVRGRTLADAVADAPDASARRRLVRAVLAAAEAGAAAHDSGIVHRDLKPSNILLGPHGETQVADWGLAMPVPAAAARWADLPALTASGPVGTPGFAAPEQTAGADPDP